MTVKRRSRTTKKAAPRAPRRRATPAPDRAHAHAHAHPHPHPAPRGTHGEKRNRHGNPVDFSAYVARLDDPGRARWQKPDRVVAALGLAKGGRAAEVGSGTGQFTIRMARRVGEAGRVYAIDVEPRMLELLAERAAAAKAWGILGILAPEGGGLPPEPVDVILMVNVLHHVRDRARYLRALATRLAPGGRLVVVDFHDRELPIGPPPDHKLAKADALAAIRKAGLRLLREEGFLPYQYLLVAGR